MHDPGRATRFYRLRPVQQVRRNTTPEPMPAVPMAEASTTRRRLPGPVCRVDRLSIVRRGIITPVLGLPTKMRYAFNMSGQLPNYWKQTLRWRASSVGAPRFSKITNGVERITPAVAPSETNEAPKPHVKNAIVRGFSNWFANAPKFQKP